MEGFRQERRGDEGGGKEAQRGQEPRRACLWATHASEFRDRQNRGKLHSPPMKNGCEEEKLRSRENRRSPERGLRPDPDGARGPPVPQPGRTAEGLRPGGPVQVVSEVRRHT